MLRTHLNQLVSLAKWSSVHLKTKEFWVRIQLQSLHIQNSRLLRARSFLTFWQLKSLDSLWSTYGRYKNIQSNGPYTYVLGTQLHHLVNLAKWLSLSLRTKWFRVRTHLQSLHLQIYCLLLANHPTMDGWFTLKYIRELTRTYSQRHCTDKYWKHSSIILSVCPNGWVLV